MADAPSSTHNRSSTVIHHPGPESPLASSTLKPGPPSLIKKDGWTYNYNINLEDAYNRKAEPLMPPRESAFMSVAALTQQDASSSSQQQRDETFKRSLPPSRQDPSGIQFRLADFIRMEIIEKGDGYTVFIALHYPSYRCLTLKVFQQLNMNESTLKLITQELKIIRSFPCPHVAACYQSFYENGTFSTISDLMNGGSLATLFKKFNKIPEHYLAAISKQVLQGLPYLHDERHVIHWDLVPSNLLWNRRGEVKIMGFDITSSLLLQHSVPANISLDMHKYSSPEVLRGDGPDHKSAIWSLGLVLLECATGHYPYIPPVETEGRLYLTELLEIILKKPLPSAPSDQFCKEFCSFISACLQKNATDRASGQKLMGHPFINMYDKMDIDLKSYFRSYFEKS